MENEIALFSVFCFYLEPGLGNFIFVRCSHRKKKNPQASQRYVAFELASGGRNVGDWGWLKFGSICKLLGCLSKRRWDEQQLIVLSQQQSFMMYFSLWWAHSSNWCSSFALVGRGRTVDIPQSLGFWWDEGHFVKVGNCWGFQGRMFFTLFRMGDLSWKTGCQGRRVEVY